MVDGCLLGYIIPVFHTPEQDAHLAGQILEKYQLSYNRAKSIFGLENHITSSSNCSGRYTEAREL